MTRSSNPIRALAAQASDVGRILASVVALNTTLDVLVLLQLTLTRELGVDRFAVDLRKGSLLLRIVNSLGAVGLAGTTWPLDRARTTQLLGFDGLVENSKLACQAFHGVDALRALSFDVIVRERRNVVQARPPHRRARREELRRGSGRTSLLTEHHALEPVP